MPSYVVYKGRVPGVYHNWGDCLREVQGYRGCIYVSYNTMAEAEARYAHYLAVERRDWMKTIIIVLHLMVTAFLVYVLPILDN